MIILDIYKIKKENRISLNPCKNSLCHTYLDYLRSLPSLFCSLFFLFVVSYVSIFYKYFLYFYLNFIIFLKISFNFLSICIDHDNYGTIAMIVPNAPTIYGLYSFLKSINNQDENPRHIMTISI